MQLTNEQGDNNYSDAEISQPKSGILQILALRSKSSKVQDGQQREN